MKYGLECEFFVKDRTGFIGNLDYTLTPDSCGFLAEARGDPQNSICKAVYSLQAAVHELHKRARKLDLTLVQTPHEKLPAKEFHKSRQNYSKGVLAFQNLYGYIAHKNPGRKTAGVHISFTKPQQVVCHFGKQSQTVDYNALFDFVSLFRYLDKKFATEIKDSSRRPGFYEIKHDGRIEYRSLPNNVNLNKVIDVIEAFNI